MAILAVAVAAATATATAGGLVPFPPYEGSKLPASAAVFSTVGTDPFFFTERCVIGYSLDTDGDVHADVSTADVIDMGDFGLSVVYSAFVSPSSSDLVYVFTKVEPGVRPFGHRIVLLERDAGGSWRIKGGPYLLPPELQQDVLYLNNSKPFKIFSSDWVQVVAVRGVDGGDTLLVVRLLADRNRNTFESRYTLLVDTDADGFADDWTPVETKENYEPMAMDDRGHILARHIPDPQHPFGSADAFLRIVDTNRDRTPETIDVDSVIDLPPRGTSTASYTDGIGDIDIGSDRLYVNRMNVTLLDSRRRPIAGSVREYDYSIGGGGIPYDPFEIVAGRDGAPVVFADYNLSSDDAVGIYRDEDFDGKVVNLSPPNPLEVRAVYSDLEFRDPSTLNVSLADLGAVDTSSGGGVVTFRDHGVYPDDTSFRFRFGSIDFESVWIGRDGIISFTGPVSGTATLDALAAMRGAIAPLWSDEWDTSRVRVHAGYAPLQTSFRTGEIVKAFAIEWRGLRAPGWDDDQGCSMRLLLYEDGSYRTDFGAMEGAELGAMRLVTGFAGPGNHASRLDVDASSHTWTFPAAGNAMERVAGEEFTAARRSDIGHLWVRWNGYPERLDAAGPIPQVIDASRRNGKIILAAAGSNIAAGATLVVDLTESFALKRKGARWIVKKKTRSVPGGRTIAEIWADGQPHRITIVNPDGEASAAVVVP